MLHALGTPPTNGANIFNPALSVPAYFPNAPTAGIGGDGGDRRPWSLALVGLALSFTTD